jgi:DNA helicase-2/ATP-dependent DNA helicase PcrA
LWQAAGALIAEGLDARAANAVRRFLALIETMARDVRGLPLHEQVDHVIRSSGLVAHYAKEKGERGEARLENLEELVSAARGFDTEDIEGLSPLGAFLAHASLEAGEGQADAWEDCVQLMTMHSAKGLEFRLVFITGMEDGLFPHQRSLSDPDGLEEERRLCYVATTRAMQQLYLSYAEQRRLHGMDSFGTPSRFLSELPGELVEEIRPKLKVARPVIASRFAPPEHAGGLRLGQHVRHRKFGEGVVLNVEGQGAHARVQVNFANAGSKWLVLAYANLEVM